MQIDKILYDIIVEIFFLNRSIALKRDQSLIKVAFSVSDPCSLTNSDPNLTPRGKKPDLKPTKIPGSGSETLD